MTAYATLFDRLNNDWIELASQNREACIMASVGRHLAKMLSTRAGSVQTLPDYGLPDLNDMRLSLHDSLCRARAAIEAFISAYEPRLSEVRVISLPNDLDQLRLAFRIEALLSFEGLSRLVSFEACLQGSGQVQVVACSATSIAFGKGR